MQSKPPEHPRFQRWMLAVSLLLGVCVPSFASPDRIPASLRALKEQASGGLRTTLELVYPQPIYVEGDRIRYRVTSDRDCHVALLAFQEDGEWVMLFPNRFEPESLLSAHEPTLIPDPSVADYDFIVGAPYGEDTICLLACSDPSELAHLLQTLQQTVDHYVALDRGIFPVSHKATELASTHALWSVEWITVRTAERLPASLQPLARPFRAWAAILLGLGLITGGVFWKPGSLSATKP